MRYVTLPMVILDKKATRDYQPLTSLQIIRSYCTPDITYFLPRCRPEPETVSEKIKGLQLANHFDQR
jgi:hypothetical protein